MVLTGLFVPVHTDETGWRFQERASIDGVDSMFNDLCGPNTLAHVPWLLMPVRAFSAAVNQSLADPIFLRIEGIACALAWAGLAWLLTARLASDKAVRASLRTILFALLGLGVLPFILVLSRPEQPVILTLTLSILITIWPAQRFSPPATAALKCAAIVILAGIATSYHMKGVAYSPVFAACLLFCASGRSTLPQRILGLALLGVITAVSMQYWVHRFQCSGDPVLAAKLAQNNVAIILSNGGSITSLFGQMIEWSNPFNYLWLMVAQNGDVWLPDNMFRIVDHPVFCSVEVALWGWVLVWSTMELGRFLGRERLKAFAEPRAPIALALIACLLVWGASQVHRGFYEAGHYLPMLAVFCTLCLTLPNPEPANPEPANPEPAAPEQGQREQWLGATARLCLLVMLPSALMVVAMSLRPMMAAGSKPGYIPGLPISVSAFGYDKIRTDIGFAMTKAGMDPAGRYNRLLIDDVTYLALQRNTFPLHRLGVLSEWNGQITDPVRFLMSRHSDGVVVGCQFLPKRMLDVAARSGEVCAISRKGLEQLDASGPNPS